MLTLDREGNPISIMSPPMTPGLGRRPVNTQGRWGTQPRPLPPIPASNGDPISRDSSGALADVEMDSDDDDASSFCSARSQPFSDDETDRKIREMKASTSRPRSRVATALPDFPEDDSSGGDTELEEDIVTPMRIQPRIVGKPVWDPTPGTYSNIAGPSKPKNYIRPLPPPPSISYLSISEAYSTIAHSEETVRLFDELHIPWSVQFRIACLVSNEELRWDQVTREVLLSLRGSNANGGARMREVLGRLLLGSGGRIMGTTPEADQALFSELDKEDEAFEEGMFRNLGLVGDGSETLGTWWGGHVEQRAILEEYQPLIQGQCKLRIRLVHQRYQKTSNRFARKFGSRRFLQVSMRFIPKSKRDEAQLEEFLLKGHVINGRVFRVFCGQDPEAPVHFVETDEDVDRSPVEEMGDFQRQSLMSFVSMHNPWTFNKKQIMSKWTARFALGLSTSQPAAIFSRKNIFFIPDLISPYCETPEDPLGKETMTDGCGKINTAAMRMIQRNQGLDNVPCAVQGRIAGAKGLWVLDVTDLSEEPKIWLTDSQVKIKYNTEPDRLATDPSLRILDLLRISQTKHPANIGYQPIINFSHNGVPTEVFSTMLQNALKEQMDTLLELWRRDTNEDTVLLWDRIFALGGLGRIRKTRGNGNSGGPQDFGIASHMRKKAREKAAAYEDVDDERTKDVDPWSGYPSELHEIAFEMIQAGFHPSRSSFLGEKVRQIMKLELERMLGKLHIPVKYSAEVFAVPDFWGVLEEGEVYFRSSQNLNFPDPNKLGSVVEGPVVIYRYPVRLPTDAQKFIAVDRFALHHLTDVVIFSSKGRRSGPSILAGGDCDGDVMCIIWDPNIVTPFTNSDVDKFADPSDQFKKNFLTTGGERVHEFLKRVEREFPKQEDREVDDVRGPLKEVQKYLLGGCKRKSNAGLYSVWADSLGYALGFDHEKAVEFAHKFCNQLDSQKSGVHIREDVFRADQAFAAKYKLPDSMQKIEVDRQVGIDPSDLDGGRRSNSKREPHLAPFVLDELVPMSKTQLQHYQSQISKLTSDEGAGDPDLLKPLMEAQTKAERLSSKNNDGKTDELKRLKQFVRDKKREWDGIFNGRGDLSRQSSISLVRSSSSASSVGKIMPMRRLDQMGKEPKRPQWEMDLAKSLLSSSFHQGFTDFDSLEYFQETHAREVMCSFAYQYALERKKFSFPFFVGFERLLSLKANAISGKGGNVVMRREFSNLLVPRRGLRKDLEALRTERMQVDEQT